MALLGVVSRVSVPNTHTHTHTHIHTHIHTHTYIFCNDVPSMSITRCCTRPFVVERHREGDNGTDRGIERNWEREREREREREIGRI